MPGVQERACTVNKTNWKIPNPKNDSSQWLSEGLSMKSYGSVSSATGVPPNQNNTSNNLHKERKNKTPQAPGLEEHKVNT